MPTTRSAKRDLIDRLCEALRRFGNAVADWHNFRQEKPEAPQLAEATAREILDLGARLRKELAGKAGATIGDLEDLRRNICTAVGWGRRLLPISVTLENEDTGERRPQMFDRDDPRVPELLPAAYDFLSPVDGVDPADLNDHWKFAKFLFALESRVRSLRAFTNSAKGADDEPSVPRRAKKAAEQYRQAAEALGKTDPTDREAYDALAKAHETAGEMDDLPSFATWRRNLTEYRTRTGTQKNTSRAGRADSGSRFPKVEEIEPQSLPSQVRPRWADR